MIRVTPLIVLLSFLVPPGMCVAEEGKQPSAQELIKILGSKTAKNEARAKAAEQLGKLTPLSKEAIPVLIENMVDPDSDISGHSFSSLVEYGKSAIPALTEALSSNNWEMRVSAVQVLECLGPKARKAIPALLPLLKDRYCPVQTSVLRTLEEMKDPATAIPIIEALAEAHPSVHEDYDHAIRALRLEARGEQRKAITKRAIPVLLKLMKRKVTLTDIVGMGQPTTHQASLALTLARWGKPGQDVLIQFLRDPSEPVEVRERAAGAFRELLRWEELLPGEHPKAAAHALTYLPVFVKLLNDPEADVRSTVISVLRNCGPKGKAAVPSLVKRLAKSGTAERQDIADALYAIDPDNPHIVPTFIGNLGSSHLGTRAMAADSLKGMRKRAVKAIPALIAMTVTDPEPDGRKVAIRALEDIALMDKRVQNRLRELAATDPDSDVRKLAERLLKSR